MRVDVALTTRAGAEFDGAWSPDGRFIVYRDSRRGINHDDEIYVVGANGKGAHNITNDPGNDWGPAWSPDGKWIAFNSDRGGTLAGFLVRPDGTGLRKLAIEGWVEYPQFSPDGTRIVYESASGSNYDVYIADIATGARTRLTSSPAADGWPAWSPDGTTIAFTSTRDDCAEAARDQDCWRTGNAGDHRDLWLIGADGSNERRVTPEHGQFIDWSPDGRYLLVLDWSSDTSSDEVIFYDLRADKIDGRVEVSTWPAHSVFSPDGKRLYVSGETAGDLTVIDVTTRTTLARHVHGGGDAMGLAMAADGKVLYAAAGENKTILKIDTATSKPVGTIALPGIVHESTLTLDGRFLYTTLRKNNKIVVIDTATDKIVATIPQKGFPDLVTMEPAGRYALVTNRWADLVSVIDLTTHTQVRTIPVGKAPHGMALRPR